jgi:tRNA(Ile)-lysidine synthase
MTPPSPPGTAVPEAIDDWCRQLGWDAQPDKLLVGVSGGVDSIVLLHALVRHGLRPHVVHVHHGLRAESDDEEAFVRSRCEALGLERTMIRAPQAPANGRQAWARQIRHRAFAHTARQYGLAWVCVAHHADDQLETQLLHLERGTGLAGLSGMPAIRSLSRTEDAPLLVRPFLAVSRAEIVEAAHAWELPWVEDASNRDTSYRRNAIRAELAALSPEELGAFRRAGAQVADRVGALRQAVRERVHNMEMLPDAALLPWPAPVRELIMLEWLALQATDIPRRRSVARQVLALQQGQAGRRVSLGGVVVWRERAGWEVRPESHRAATSRLRTERLVLPEGTLADKLAILRQHAAARGGASHAFVDADRLAGPPALRAWRAGDRFQPLGMDGSRKIKAYLTDRKVSPAEKAHVPVCSDGKAIVWVVGHQSDHRYRIRGSTREAVILWTPDAAGKGEDIAG